MPGSWILQKDNLRKFLRKLEHTQVPHKRLTARGLSDMHASEVGIARQDANQMTNDGVWTGQTGLCQQGKPLTTHGSLTPSAKVGH